MGASLDVPPLVKTWGELCSLSSVFCLIASLHISTDVTFLSPLHLYDAFSTFWNILILKGNPYRR
jgi:hypothetical protein